jgi:hypothetical protein
MQYLHSDKLSVKQKGAFIERRKFIYCVMCYNKGMKIASSELLIRCWQIQNHQNAVIYMDRIETSNNSECIYRWDGSEWRQQIDHEDGEVNISYQCRECERMIIS